MANLWLTAYVYTDTYYEFEKEEKKTHFHVRMQAGQNHRKYTDAQQNQVNNIQHPHKHTNDLHPRETFKINNKPHKKNVDTQKQKIYCSDDRFENVNMFALRTIKIRTLIFGVDI